MGIIVFLIVGLIAGFSLGALVPVPDPMVGSAHDPWHRRIVGRRSRLWSLPDARPFRSGPHRSKSARSSGLILRSMGGRRGVVA